MLAAITGTPGAGKTLFMMRMVHEQEQYQGRPVYYNGINGCTVSGWVELDDIKFQTWYDHIPDNSVLLVDEAQREFESGTPSDKLTDKLKKLETHRHRGIDVIVTCQAMSQIHARFKVLIGLHLHFERPHSGETWYCFEWTTFRANPSADSNKALAIKTDGKYKDAEKYFGMYKSATDHTYKNRFPKKYFVYAALAGVFMISMVTFAVQKVAGITSTGENDVVEQAPPVAKGFAAFGEVGRSVKGKKKEFTLAELLRLTTPLVKNQPDTAPIYEELWAAQDYPREQVIMWASGDQRGVCRTYSQQGTRMRVDASTCQLYIAEGFEFDHRLAPTESQRGFSDQDEFASRGQETAFVPWEQKPVIVIDSGGAPSFPNVHNSYGTQSGGIARARAADAEADQSGR